MVHLINTSKGIFNLNQMVKTEFNPETGSLLIILTRQGDGMILLYGEEAKTLHTWLKYTAVFSTTEK